MHVYHLRVDDLVHQGVLSQPLAERLIAYLRAGGLLVLAGAVCCGKSVVLNALVRAVATDMPVTVLGENWGLANEPNVTLRDQSYRVRGHEPYAVITAQAPEAGLYVVEEVRAGELVTWLSAAPHGGITCVAIPLDQLGWYLADENEHGRLAQALQSRPPLWIVSLSRPQDQDHPQMIEMLHLSREGHGSQNVVIEELFVRDRATESAERGKTAWLRRMFEELNENGGGFRLIDLKGDDTGAVSMQEPIERN